MVYALTPNSMHMKERKMREEWYPQRRRTPSFSSTLLDTIYRSIDESKSNLDEDPQLGLFKETTTRTPKQSNLSHTHSAEKSGNNKEKMNLRRAVMIEDWNWMEKQTSQPHTSHQFVNSITSTSSSESSTSRAVFSSSETDTTHKPKPKPRPKSVRNNNNNSEQQKPKREGNGGGGGGFARTKLRALKIYGELNQKVKQPLSPGSRIASFLSSLFNTAGSVKKTKMCYVGAVEDVSFNRQNKSNKSPPCSRRSCMSSKTPSSSSSSSSAKAKRTVRFYPVSVILGEDHISHSQLPSGHVYTYENDPSLLPLPSVRRMTKDQVKKNCAGVAKENGFMKGYQNSCKGGGNGNQYGFRGFYDNGDEDDALSCSSSDLFELDHLVGAAGRYQEELPVYETTNLETNKAIANGLRL